MGVSGGQSKSSGSSSQTSPYAPELAKFGRQELKAAEPVQQQLLAQEGEALRTGGITNRIPIQNREVDAARQAGSQSAQQTRDILSKYGLANSAFGARTIAEQTAQTNQGVANVPANDTERILSQAPQEVASAQGIGAGLLGEAGQLDINQIYQNQQTQAGGKVNILPPDSSLL
jgi:hypothetical protein